MPTCYSGENGSFVARATPPERVDGNAAVISTGGRMSKGLAGEVSGARGGTGEEDEEVAVG